MATKLFIDSKLLDRALQVSGERTNKAVVTKALREFIARREQANIIDLFGAFGCSGDYDDNVGRTSQ